MIKRQELKNIAQNIIVLLSVLILTGCLEASFELSKDSRLPKFIQAPAGIPRSELEVKLDAYYSPSGFYGVYTLYKKGSIFSIQKVKVKNIKGPYTLQDQATKYPLYTIDTVNGITDIIEHRKMEPIFYTTDDPAIWKELNVKQ